MQNQSLYSLDFEGKRSISDGFKRFLLRVLEKDPSKRYTLEMMKKDEWINDGLPPLISQMSHVTGMDQLHGSVMTNGLPGVIRGSVPMMSAYNNSMRVPLSKGKY